MATSNFVAYTKFADLEKYGDEYLINKAPFQIPDSVREFLVKFGPYAMIVFMILWLLAYLNLYGTYANLSQYSMMYGYGGMMGTGVGNFWTPTIVISIIASLVAFVIQIKALPGLLARKKEGWEYMTYASLVWLIPNVLNVQIIGLVIGFVISMYILFQLKYMYK